MSNSDDLRKLMQRLQYWENRMGKQQLQLKALKAVTQGINDNLGADELYQMMKNFLSFEMGIGRFCLIFRCAEGHWKPVSSQNCDIDIFDAAQVIPILTKFGSGTKKIETATDPFVQQFELTLQVMHKSQPLAFVVMADLNQENLDLQLDFVTTVANVVAIAIENKRLFKDQLQQKLINREVELAAEIQQALVPRRLPQSALFELSSIYRPHFAVGGDYYDVVEFPDGKIAFCIADITGKGVSAALLMANFQATFHALVPRRPSLEEIVHEMNAAVHRVTGGDKFITLFLGKYDPKDRTLHYINCGHTPPFLLTGNEVIRLKNGTTVLGSFDELPFIEVGGVCLTDQALLFSYTDGLTDLRNPQQEEFDEEVLLRFLQQHQHLQIRSLNEELLSYIDVFRAGMPYPDDITVLTCKFLAD
jgi:phosphoserine phosphatase RsbU/P